MTTYLGSKPVGINTIRVVEKQVVSDEWQPNPKWWDIKKILDEDTRDYKGKVGVILYNFNDVSNFQLSSSGMTAVATSDGAFYTYADNGANVSHNWDTSKDKDDGRGFKTRWVIYYYTSDTTSDTFGRTTAAKFGWKDNHIAYLVLRINILTSNYGTYAFSRHDYLEGIDNDGYVITFPQNASYLFYQCKSLQTIPDNIDLSTCTTMTDFCSGCYLLQKLPDNLNTSNIISLNGFCYTCYSLQKLPDNLDTSNCTSFSSFCGYCISLQKLPDNLDTSNGTNFNSFCGYCYSLKKLPDNLDTSKGTSFSSFAYSSTCLQKVYTISMAANTTAITSKYSGPFTSDYILEEILLTLPSNTNFWLDSSTCISIKSFRYIADHAPDVTATPRTLTVGSTNISRINAADPTIITDLNARGWSVN